ncbi:hypothetical protein SLE2022_375400 [Rubroshorea leprosula]
MLPILHNLRKGNTLVLRDLKWIPKDDRLISFWNDIWVGHRPLSFILNRPLLEVNSSLLVSNCISQDQLLNSAISYDLPPNIAQSIKAIPLSLFATRFDQFAWKFNANGFFFSSSAYCLAKNTFLHPNQD